MISNGSIILNVDCDMYSNNSESVRDSLCFLMDDEKGHEFAFVQFPQFYNNLTRNDLYGNCFRVINEVGHLERVEYSLLLGLEEMGDSLMILLLAFGMTGEKGGTSRF